MSHSERKLTLADGATTIVESWGDGPVILCIHGITSSRKSWKRFGEHFAGRFRTCAYDQSGHGDSAAFLGPMTHARSIENARIVAASLGAPVAAVVGHSWGGAIAILAGLEIESARAVVAVDPMIYVPPGTWSADYLDDAAADLALDPQAREVVLRERLASWHEVDVAGKLHAMLGMRAEAIAKLGAENGVDAGGWDLRPILRDYPKRLLVAAAEPGESVMSQDELAGLRDSPNVTVAEFPGEGHNLHRTAFDRFATITERFLES